MIKSRVNVNDLSYSYRKQLVQINHVRGRTTFLSKILRSVSCQLLPLKLRFFKSIFLPSLLVSSNM
jgi:hypothetical protein